MVSKKRTFGGHAGRVVGAPPVTPPNSHQLAFVSVRAISSSAIVPRMLQLIDPVQKQIILLKLVDLLDKTPDFPGTGTIAGESPQRQWVSRAGALPQKS